ncbi:hypothetical protein DOTSEDRAFT_29649 [Dothistroma septosporum NZE10]|uniref:Uncharacterized protein n=1 Tax=Dothistroma septosporum (strain NZE10 / CBS 128990) TaxID=675120 RepID=M2YHP4_DOTSN|nr:hypothetical protein DOTSEDRAFT_29649 [Dothistroma septosporum NZE10]
MTDSKQKLSPGSEANTDTLACPLTKCACQETTSPSSFTYTPPKAQRHSVAPSPTDRANLELLFAVDLQRINQGLIEYIELCDFADDCHSQGGSSFGDDWIAQMTDWTAENDEGHTQEMLGMEPWRTPALYCGQEEQYVDRGHAKEATEVTCVSFESDEEEQSYNDNPHDAWLTTARSLAQAGCASKRPS